MTLSGMDKSKNRKELDIDTLAEVTQEMAKPRGTVSAREHRDTDGNGRSTRATGNSPLDPMELLRKKVDEELAAPSQASTGMLPTPNLNACLKLLGVRA